MSSVLKKADKLNLSLSLSLSLSAIRQQALTCVIVEPDLCRYMASLDHNDDWPVQSKHLYSCRMRKSLLWLDCY